MNEWMNGILSVEGVKARRFLKGESVEAEMKQSTVGQNRRKHRINSHLIIHFPMSKGMSEVNERANK